MIIEFLDKDDNVHKFSFEADKKNIVILNGLLYELTNDEYRKFCNGDYAKQHLNGVKEGYISSEFDLGLYVHDAPFNLDYYYLTIK